MTKTRFGNAPKTGAYSPMTTRWTYNDALNPTNNVARTEIFRRHERTHFGAE
jgi:hypothetical protein